MFENVIYIDEILSIRNIIIYLIIINLIGFYMMWSDKKKAQNGSWRISENALLVVTALGGGIGTISGMYLFRHKTKKLKFTIGLPFILILEIIFVLLYI